MRQQGIPECFLASGIRNGVKNAEVQAALRSLPPYLLELSDVLRGKHEVDGKLSRVKAEINSLLSKETLSPDDEIDIECRLQTFSQLLHQRGFVRSEQLKKEKEAFRTFSIYHYNTLRELQKTDELIESVEALLGEAPRNGSHKDEN